MEEEGDTSGHHAAIYPSTPHPMGGIVSADHGDMNNMDSPDGPDADGDGIKPRKIKKQKIKVASRHQQHD